jgi:glycosyltransferase involved in cell wall biosynthesis
VENKGYIIIPARNEEQNIPFVLTGILSQSKVPQENIIIADNGSTDATVELARSYGVTVVTENNLGYGSACLAALSYIQSKEILPEWILVMDGDGSDDPQDITAFLQKLKVTNADIVIGSRTIGTAEMGSLGFIQRFGNALTCFLLYLFYRKKYTDLGPMRIIRFSAFSKMNLKDKTWGWNIEMHIRAIQEGLEILEIPVNYRRRKHGVSKISGTLLMALRVGIKILYTFFKLTLFSKFIS